MISDGFCIIGPVTVGIGFIRLRTETQGKSLLLLLFTTAATRRVALGLERHKEKGSERSGSSFLLKQKNEVITETPLSEILSKFDKY